MWAPCCCLGFPELRLGACSCRGDSCKQCSSGSVVFPSRAPVQRGHRRVHVQPVPQRGHVHQRGERLPLRVPRGLPPPALPAAGRRLPQQPLRARQLHAHGHGVSPQPRLLLSPHCQLPAFLSFLRVGSQFIWCLGDNRGQVGISPELLPAHLHCGGFQGPFPMLASWIRGQQQQWVIYAPSAPARVGASHSSCFQSRARLPSLSAAPRVHSVWRGFSVCCYSPSKSFWLQLPFPQICHKKV